MPLQIPASLTVWARGPHVDIWFAVCLDAGAWVFGCAGEPSFVTAALDRVRVDGLNESIIVRDSPIWIVYLSVHPAQLAFELAMDFEDVSRPRIHGEYRSAGYSQHVIPPDLSSSIARYVLARGFDIHTFGDDDPTDLSLLVALAGDAEHVQGDGA